MSYGLHEADPFAMICGELRMVSRERPDEECQGARALVEHLAKACAGSVALHRKDLFEARELQHSPEDKASLRAWNAASSIQRKPSFFGSSVRGPAIAP